MPDPNLCQNNPECLHQSSLDIERPGGVSDLGLGKVGVWVDCRVWGQPGSSHHRTWKFRTPQLKVRRGQTLLIPPSPFSLLPEGAAVVTPSGQKKDALLT